MFRDLGVVAGMERLICDRSLLSTLLFPLKDFSLPIPHFHPTPHQGWDSGKCPSCWVPTMLGAHHASCQIRMPCSVTLRTLGLFVLDIDKSC